MSHQESRENKNSKIRFTSRGSRKKSRQGEALEIEIPKETMDRLIAYSNAEPSSAVLNPE